VNTGLIDSVTYCLSLIAAATECNLIGEAIGRLKELLNYKHYKPQAITSAQNTELT
jgi:hypothetical protein